MRLCIAYGSNCNLKQMAKRCPDSVVYGVGVIRGYILEFRGSANGAYATISRVADKNATVPVAVWKIGSALDEQRLDLYEGAPKFYKKETIEAELENGEFVEAFVYIMNFETVNLPSPQYFKVVEQGYKDNNLDLNYLYKSLEDCKKIIGLRHLKDQ